MKRPGPKIITEYIFYDFYVNFTQFYVRLNYAQPYSFVPNVQKMTQIDVVIDEMDANR